MKIKKYIKKFERIISKRSSTAFIKYLKKNGLKIGEFTHFYDPKTVFIDPNRLNFIEIGQKCQITRNVTILAHDFSYSVCRSVYNDLPQNSRLTIIGDNVFIGMNSTILMGSNIGNNVIIGAGSVVSGNIPSNCVIGGAPCKIICTLDEYYQKRCKDFEKSALIHAANIIIKEKRIPTIDEMGFYSTLFIKNNVEKEKLYKKFVYSSDDYNEIVNCLIKKKNKYNNYQDFLKEVEKFLESKK